MNTGNTSTAVSPKEDRVQSLVVFLIAALVSMICLAAGGALTSLGLGEWYDNLAKPSWQPPPWAFTAAWTTIFALKAFAVWLVARRGLEPPGVKLALTVYVLQLALNVGWSAIFFALKSPTAALVEIVALDVFVAATIFCFFRVSRTAAALLAPYAGWLGLATAINVWIVAHLGDG